MTGQERDSLQTHEIIHRGKLKLVEFIFVVREGKRSPYAYLRGSGVSARSEPPVRAAVTGSSMSKISSFTNSSRLC
jgi:hypothetical protein